MELRIRTAREKFKVTQEELANKVNISVSHLSSIEQNRRQPSVELLVKIAEALGITTSELIGEISFIGLKFLNGIPKHKLASTRKLIVACMSLGSTEICALAKIISTLRK